MNDGPREGGGGPPASGASADRRSPVAGCEKPRDSAYEARFSAIEESVC